MAFQNLKIAVSDGISETLIREMTDEEIANLQKAQEDIAAEKQLEIAEAEAKAAQRQALLSRLGITEEEARILLGGN